MMSLRDAQRSYWRAARRWSKAATVTYTRGAAGVWRVVPWTRIERALEEELRRVCDERGARMREALLGRNKLVNYRREWLLEPCTTSSTITISREDCT